MGVVMRVYLLGWSCAGGLEAVPARPLTSVDSSEMRRALSFYEAGVTSGRKTSGAESVKDLAEQIRIILFAREMGWL